MIITENILQLMVPIEYECFLNNDINSIVYETIYYQNTKEDIIDGVLDLFHHDEILDEQAIVFSCDKAILLYESLSVVLKRKLSVMRELQFNTLLNSNKLNNGTSLWIIKT